MAKSECFPGKVKDEGSPEHPAALWYARGDRGRGAGIVQKAGEMPCFLGCDWHEIIKTKVSVPFLNGVSDKLDKVSGETEDTFGVGCLLIQIEIHIPWKNSWLS